MGEESQRWGAYRCCLVSIKMDILEIVREDDRLWALFDIGMFNSKWKFFRWSKKLWIFFLVFKWCFVFHSFLCRKSASKAHELSIRTFNTSYLNFKIFKTISIVFLSMNNLDLEVHGLSYNWNDEIYKVFQWKVFTYFFEQKYLNMSDFLGGWRYRLIDLKWASFVCQSINFQLEYSLKPICPVKNDIYYKKN